MLLWSDQSNLCEGGLMTTQTPSIGEQAQAFMAGPAAAMPAEVMERVRRRAGRPGRRGRARGGERTGCADARRSSCSMSAAPRHPWRRFAPGGPRWWCSIGARGARSATSRYAPTRPNWRPPSPIGHSYVIAVSPQKPDGSLNAAQTNELTYAVVSDPGNQLASRAGHSDRARPRRPLPHSRSWDSIWPSTTPMAA